MMSFEEWRSCILDAARNIASREFQEEAWFPGGKVVVSSPDEAYLGLMEDCTADLFFETYGERFTGDQLRCWDDFRSRLETYYDQMPRRPDPRQILDDPAWDLVRQSAQSFVRSFAGDA